MDKDPVISAVVVPLFQAALTGFLASVAAGTVAILAHWQDPLTTACLVLAVVTLAAWLIFRAEAVDRLHPRPVVKAEPVQVYQSVTHTLALSWNDGHTGEWLGLQDWEKFRDWAIGVSSGQSLGESHWTGRTAPFSKGEYHQMIDRLLERGIIRMRGKYHAQGYELTGKGRAVTGEITRRYGNLPSPTNHRYLAGGAN